MLKSFISRSRIDGNVKLQELNNISLIENLNHASKEKNNHLEIGFGNGDSIIRQALSNKNRVFFGIETYQTGILRAKRKAEELGMKNIFFLYGDATNIIKNIIGNIFFEKIQILFPDPWEKNKYKKRRLINENFIKLLVNCMNPGSSLCFATDCKEYLSIVKNMKYTEFYTYQSKYPHLTRPLTKFEKRAIRSEESVFELVFKLK